MVGFCKGRKYNFCNEMMGVELVYKNASNLRKRVLVIFHMNEMPSDVKSTL